MTKPHDSKTINNGLRAARRHIVGGLLRSVFGMERLRDGQRQVIDSVLDGKDTLAIMPTGSGKSLCYQIPAKMLDGVTLVVSPLIALMKDQLEKLGQLGIAAVQLNSSLTREEEDAALAGIAGAAHEIVFCTPERLAMPEFLAVLRQLNVALVVVDEAHCISHWGHDFRPAYLEMAASIDALGRPPVLALTATATDDVIEDIGRQLGRPRIAVINTGIYRPNLHYSVDQVTNDGDRYARALELVRATEGVGIIYAATVKTAEQMYRMLEEAGESAALYHGKLPAALRKQSQDLFMAGERRVMVATNAFGMGIDKSDTRFVIHLQVPANLEAYYQESGRAGRDGADADCILLFYQGDKRLQQFFLAKHYPAAPELAAVYEAARALAGEEGPITFDRLDERVDELASGKLKICLKMLKDGGLLRQNRKLEYLLTAGEPRPVLFEQLSAVYAQKQERDRETLERMVGYAVSGFCRWKVLLDYFGDAAPGFERCCRCDNCLRPPEVQFEPGEVFEQQPVHAPEPLVPPFEIGAHVKVPRFDTGTVLTVAGDQVTIEFPDHGTRTFMAQFVAPA